MTENNNVTHPPKVKVVTTINNINIGNAEIGELFYDSATHRLYVRVVSGWKYVAFT